MSAAPNSLPDGLLLAFYGDDFTGSSAVMEVLAFAGLKTVMFVAPPSAAELRRFASYRAVGIASVARAQPPAWMDQNLPPAFEALAALGAPINHYKICSTLDSSPTLGSIGRAVDLGVPIFGRRPGAAPWQPLLVAAPAIRRYQAFGNLFAVHDGTGYRLDRHPVMRDHPATPMHEADVRLHLAAQTARPLGLVDIAAMKAGTGEARFAAELEAGRRLVALDVIDDETLAWCGGLIWNNRGQGLFAVGSQGIEYALVAYWLAAGLLPAAPGAMAATAVERIVAVSGSVSSITAGQIDWAEAHGFDVISLDAALAVDTRQWDAALARATVRAGQTLAAGRSPLLVTARGPNDPAVGRMRAAVTAARLDPAVVNARVGRGLGSAAGRLLRDSGVRRLVVSGGDSSGFAAGALGIFALEPIAPLAPGAPLCRAFAASSASDGLEIALKGGQMGSSNYFGSVRAGRATS